SSHSSGGANAAAPWLAAARRSLSTKPRAASCPGSRGCTAAMSTELSRTSLTMSTASLPRSSHASARAHASLAGDDPATLLGVEPAVRSAPIGLGPFDLDLSTQLQRVGRFDPTIRFAPGRLAKCFEGPVGVVRVVLL